MAAEDAPQPPPLRRRIVVVTHHLPWVCRRTQPPAAADDVSHDVATDAPPSHFHRRRHSSSARSLSGSFSATAATATAPHPHPISSSSNTNQHPLHPPKTVDDAHHPDRYSFDHRRGHSALFSGVRLLADAEPLDEIVHVGWLGYSNNHNHHHHHHHLHPANSNFTNSNNNHHHHHGPPGAPDADAVVPTPSSPPALIDGVRQALWSQKRCVPVILDDAAARAHYEGYCKSVLWPLFHYILWDHPTNGTSEAGHWDDYVAVNQAFADAAISVCRPGDAVWIHDYHLLLVPAMVRRAVPDAQIGFFLHTPFPSSEIFRCLPMRTQILSGVLGGANLVGFQTYSHARHFISSCTRVLGCESSPAGVEFCGFNVAIGIFPIGIDVARLEACRKSDAVAAKIKSIRELFPGKKIIIGRDKLDHIKGVQHKLNAFEKFLQLFPEWQDKVALVQVTSPPQRASPLFASRISEAVSRINGTYGSLQFLPVHHYHQNLDQDEYYALLTMADIALITSIRDGMNTSSHEYVVCQQENKGCLILSEFTGTAGSMSGAYLVNPWDYVGVAHAINDALVFPTEDRAIKHRQLLTHVKSHTAQFWATSFIRELRRTALVLDHQNPTPSINIPRVLDAYGIAKRRLLMFDYDGTLAPIRKVPNAAVPSPDMLQAMQILVRDPRNVVFVISGRDQACLDNWLGHIPNLGLSAEHGSFIKYPGGKWINLAAEIDLSWKPKVSEIFNFFTERTQGSFVEQKRYAITWHYRLADPEYGSFQAKECRNHLENAILSKLPVEILVGKKNLEVRPIAMNKGEIARRLIQQRVQSGGCDFVYCVGDDRTDEDMFKAVRKAAVTVVGGTGVSAAVATSASSSASSSATPSALASPKSLQGAAVTSTASMPGSALTHGPVATNTTAATAATATAASSVTNGFPGLDDTKHFTCTIGPSTKKTHAQWHCSAPQDVIDLMGQFADITVNTMSTLTVSVSDGGYGGGCGGGVSVSAPASLGLSTSGLPSAVGSGSHGKASSASPSISAPIVSDTGDNKPTLSHASTDNLDANGDVVVS